MGIIFRSTPIMEPFTFDSLGNHWNQEDVSRPKGYPFYHYLQTEKGEGKVKIEEETYILHENEGIMIAPFINHSYNKISSEWYTLFATFTGSIESSISQILGNRKIILTDKNQGIRIASLISDSIKIYSDLPVDERSLSVNCYSLLISFADGIHTERLINDPCYKNYVEPVIEEIELHYNKELTVENLSRLVFITPQYLSRLFRRYLNCSTYEYLTSCRIRKAKELLLTQTSLEVQDIAHMSGFSDVSHFIAIFKKICGFTPLEFRKMN